MISLKNLTKAILISSTVAALSACNGGGGSSWNSADIGGGSGRELVKVSVSNNYYYGVTREVTSPQNICLSRSPIGENTWSNVRCDGSAIDYAVDDVDNVYVVKVAPGSGYWNNYVALPLSVYITDANNNQIGKTLNNCTVTEEQRSSPDYVACVYPPYYGSSQFMARNGKIYFMGNGWIYTPVTSNSATEWNTNVLDYKLNETYQPYSAKFGGIVGGGIGSSGTMYISAQWAGVYTEGNYTNYVTSSNGGGPTSWQAGVYTNSELPMFPHENEYDIWASQCITGSIWEYQNLVVAGVYCDDGNVATNYIKTMPKGSYAADWTTIQTVPDFKTSNASAYTRGGNVMYGVRTVGYDQQVVVVMPQIIPN